MTDKYGTDDAGHESGHEMSEAETWDDNQPPVDDFADQPLEETATVSEESEAADEGHVEASEQPKKKSVMLPVAAAMGGLLFLGAVLYWQFGPSSSSTPAVPPPPPLSTAKNTSETAPAPATDNANAGNSAAPENNVAPTTSLAAADTKVPSGASGVAMPAPLPPSAAPATPGTLSPDVLAKAPPVPSVTPPAPAPAPVTPVAAATPAVPAAPSAGGSIDARLEALTAHVESMQKSLAETTRQLGQVSNMVAASAVASPSGAPAANPALEERLNKLEQQIMQMQHATPVTAPSPVVTQETPTEVVADATPEKPVVHMAASSHKHKTPSRHVASHTSRKTKMVHTPKGSMTGAKWVLRAATPEEAWVSAGEGSDDFRHVQVGDTLSGVGRIQSIRQNGDDWVVVGSKGTIH